MAINFDTTIGGISSTSYVTVEEFNNYVEKLVDADGIPKSSQTTLIKKFLIAATEVVDADLYNSTGNVTDSTQALEYPRTGISDRRGNAIDENTIPQELKDAVCEMAIYLSQNELNHAQFDNWEDAIESASAGGTVNFTYSIKSKPTTLLPSRVKFLLQRMGNAYNTQTARVWRS